MITNIAALRGYFWNALVTVFVVIVVTFTPIVVKAEDQIRVVGSHNESALISTINKAFEQHKVQRPLVEFVEEGNILERFCAGMGSAYPDIAVSSHQLIPSEVQSCRTNKVGDITERVIDVEADPVPLTGYIYLKNARRHDVLGGAETLENLLFMTPPGRPPGFPHSCPPDC